MNRLEKLEQEAFENRVKVHDYYLGEDSLKGIYIDGNIAINTSVSNSIEKSCVLAEELGHYHTTCGDILDQDNVQNRKQEFRARMWGYNRLIGLTGIVRAYEYGCRNRFEIAEYLDVTEEYLDEALSYYRQRYGVFTTVDNYIIYFEPSLIVYKTVNDDCLP